jgi:hypothetical protein
MEPREVADAELAAALAHGDLAALSPLNDHHHHAQLGDDTVVIGPLAALSTKRTPRISKDIS